MKDTDTPRTDAEETRIQRDRSVLTVEEIGVMANFTRTLERENAALRAALEAVISVADRKTVEFDQARAALALGKAASSR